MTVDGTVNTVRVVARNTVAYTWWITNSTTDTRNFTFMNTLVPGQTFTGSVAVIPPTGSARVIVDDGSLGITGLRLGPRQSMLVRAHVAMSPTVPAGVMYNQARLIVDGRQEVRSDLPGTPDPADPTRLMVEPTPARGADLSITKTLQGGGTSNIVVPGGTFSYIITVTNNGPRQSPLSMITDEVPAGLTPVDASQGILNNRLAIWDIGLLAPGASVQRTLTVQADQAAGPSRVENRATVAASGWVPDRHPNNNTSHPPVSTSIVTPLPALGAS